MPSPKPHERVIRFVTERAPVWQERMGLNHWHIDHVFLDSYFGDDDQEDFKVTATTESRWQYMQAKVKWYLPSATRHDDVELDRILVHELCHVLLAPEQALVDARLVGDAERERFTDSEHALLVERNYEHLEMATEMCARAVIAGWLDR